MMITGNFGARVLRRLQRQLRARPGLQPRWLIAGGGIDTQRTLPFGTPEQVRAEVHERMRIFGPGGGFVFNTIHNVQSRVPQENLVALYEAVREYRKYPIA